MAQRRRAPGRLRRAPAESLAAVVTAAAVLASGGGALAWSATSSTDASVTGVDAVVEPVPTLTVPAARTASAAPRPAATTKAKPAKAKRLTLAQLRAAVKAVDDDLARRTAEYERGAALLASSRNRLAAVQAEATRARAEATQARDDLGRFAAAAYRGGQVPSDLVVLMAPPAGATDTLRGLQSVEQAGLTKTDIATYARDTAARAADLERQAQEITDANATNAYRLATQRDELKALAASTQKQLTAEVARVAAVKARKLAANCRAKAKLAQEFPNGLIPAAVLCAVDATHLLRGDAAVAFKELAAAYQKKFDAPVCITSAYRTRALQAKLFAADPVMVAVPGRSFHGLGLALDLCGGIERFGTPQHRWMKKNAATYGWYHPTWAEPTGVTPEPWHWEYGTGR